MKPSHNTPRCTEISSTRNESNTIVPITPATKSITRSQSLLPAPRTHITADSAAKSNRRIISRTWETTVPTPSTKSITTATTHCVRAQHSSHACRQAFTSTTHEPPPLESLRLEIHCGIGAKLTSRPDPDRWKIITNEVHSAFPGPSETLVQHPPTHWQAHRSNDTTTTSPCRYE